MDDAFLTFGPEPTSQTGFHVWSIEPYLNPRSLLSLCFQAYKSAATYDLHAAIATAFSLTALPAENLPLFAEVSVVRVYLAELETQNLENLKTSNPQNPCRPTLLRADERARHRPGGARD